MTDPDTRPCNTGAHNPVEFTPGIDLGYELYRLGLVVIFEGAADAAREVSEPLQQHEHVWYPAAPYSEALRCACGATTTYCAWRSGLYGGTLGGSS